MSKIKEGKERRRHSRLPVEIEVEGLRRAGAVIPQSQGFILNISPTGILLEAKDFFKKGIDLALSFTLPSGITYTNYQVSVVWAKKVGEDFQHGCTFKGMGFFERQKFKKEIQKLGTKEEEDNG